MIIIMIIVIKCKFRNPTHNLKLYCLTFKYIIYHTKMSELANLDRPLHSIT